MKSHFLGFVLAGFLGLALMAGCSSSSTPAAATCNTSSTCPGGSPVQACVTKNGDGTCSGIYYTVGSQTFQCNSCTDTTSCASAAVSACLGDAGTGFDFDSGTTENLDSGATPG